MVIEKNITLESHCEHHMAPIIGVAHVSYIPNKKVVGLSKLARTVEIFSKNQLIQTILEDNKKTFEFLTRKKLSSSHKDNSVTLPFKEFDFEISTSQIDKSKIKEKLQENKSSLEKEKNTIDKNLSNENFVSKAPKDLIDQNKERQSSINMELSKIDSILMNIQ